MSISSSWIHGNILTIETPVAAAIEGGDEGRFILTPSAPGAIVTIEGPSHASWMHLPIPTIYESTTLLNPFLLRRVIILCKCSGGNITDVHIYDGSTKIKEFASDLTPPYLPLHGDYLTRLPGNTFELDSPRKINTGIGVSFMCAPFSTSGGHGAAEPTVLQVAAVGAEFDTEGSIIRKLLSVFRRPGR